VRVALLTREYLAETQWGGIGAFYSDFARGLLAAGAQVEVFTQSLEREGSEAVDGAVVHRCLPRWYALGQRRGGALAGMPARDLGWFALALARELALRFERRHDELPFDVVESHEHLGVGALLGPRAPRARHVVRYHTAYHVLVDRGLEPWPRSRLVRWLEGRALQRADLRIAPTAFIERTTREHFPGVPGADATIPLSSRFAPDESVLARKEPLVVFVGRLEGRKRPMLAVDAFRAVAERFPAWRLEVAGADAPGPGGSSTWEACRARLGSAASRCVYRGALDARALADLYARASVCIVPSTFESFGLVALEAMSFGCVPLVTAGHALEEVIGSAGRVAPEGDDVALAEGLERLLADPADRDARARRAIALVRERYDASVVLQRNLALFEEIARRPREAA